MVERHYKRKTMIASVPPSFVSVSPMHQPDNKRIFGVLSIIIVIAIIIGVVVHFARARPNATTIEPIVNTPPKETTNEVNDENKKNLLIVAVIPVIALVVCIGSILVYVFKNGWFKRVKSEFGPKYNEYLTELGKHTTAIANAIRSGNKEHIDQAHENRDEFLQKNTPTDHRL